MVREGFDELLDEERDALGFLQDQLLESRVEVVRAQEVSHHGKALPVGEPIQVHLIVIGAAAPRVDVFGPVGEDEEDRRPGDALQQEFQTLL
jgi:hypothetical protein